MNKKYGHVVCSDAIRAAFPYLHQDGTLGVLMLVYVDEKVIPLYAP